MGKRLIAWQDVNRRALHLLLLLQAKKWWTLLKAGLKLWPLVGILTYTIVPVRHRLLW